MQPYVSVIVPCYNEEKTIRQLLDSLIHQTYPGSRTELIISDGMSTDRTLTLIAEFQEKHPACNLKVVRNPLRTIPSGLNQAINLARGEILIRLDAHSLPIPEYIERCVAAHEAGKGDNVGGVWDIQPGGETWLARSISIAAAHPLGVGDALYRLNAREGRVDTVPFGSFRRTLIERVGLFDETLLANEDYEFNARVRQAGGVVWLDPTIRSIYFSRNSLSALARQYWRYGYWKFRMLVRYPNTLRWRQALPPLFALSLLGLIVLSLWSAYAGYLLAAEVCVYGFILGLAGLEQAVRRKTIFLIWGLPLAISTMHLAWGAGFLWSALITPFYKHD